MTIEENNEDLITLRGIVREILPDFTFKVEIDGGAKFMLAKGSGRLRKKRIKIAVLDKVEIEVSKYDLRLGRIAKRIDDKKEDFTGKRANKQFKKPRKP
jgi:translation initiation factor IF-1